MRRKFLTVCLCIVMIITMMPFGAVYGIQDKSVNIPKIMPKVLTVNETLDYAIKNNCYNFMDLHALLGDYSPTELYGLEKFENAGVSFERTDMGAGDPYYMVNTCNVHYNDRSDSFKGYIYEVNLFEDKSGDVNKVKENLKSYILNKLSKTSSSDAWDVVVDKYNKSNVNNVFDNAADICEKYEIYSSFVKWAGYGKHLDNVYVVQIKNNLDSNKCGFLFVTALDETNTVESIRISQKPYKLKYLPDDFYVDVEGGIIEATYTDGTKENIPMRDMMITNHDSVIFESTGNHTLDVMYGGKFASYTISVGEDKWKGYTPISTKEDLNKVRNNLSGKYYLTDDIVFSKEDFEPGGQFYNNGAGWIPIDTFSGVFDGDGHKISGLVVNANSDTGDCYAGLFGQVNDTYYGPKVCISNLIMENCSINATSKYDDAYAGSIAGHIDGATIKNCNVSGSITSPKYAGGIAGQFYTVSIENCSNNSSVTGDYAGGIVAFTYGAKTVISNCANLGCITGKSNVGGIAGSSSSAIRQCYNSGDVPVDGHSVGGIAGSNHREISNCYNIGTIGGLEESNKAGGIAGSNYSVIEKSYNIGYVTADDTCSIAVSNHDRILDCYYIGEKACGSNFGTDESVKCTVDDFKRQGTFAGFDFDNVWTMEGDSNYLFPELKNTKFNFKKELAAIEVRKVPDKTKYVVGDTDLDLTGGELTLVYNDKSEEVIKLTKDMIADFDTSSYGNKSVTVKYKGKTTTFNISVKEIYSIRMHEGPVKLEYVKGYDDLDLTGTTIKVRFDYWGDDAEIIPVTKDMISGFDNTKEGYQTIVVTYRGHTTSFDVNIVPVTATSVKIVKSPSENTVYGKEYPNLKGAKLKVKYNNNTEKVVDITKDMISGYYQGMSVGTHSLDVYYDGKYANMDIKIVPASILEKNIKLEYDTCKYNGNERCPSVTYPGLDEGLDYNVSYKNNVNIGTATVTITGKGNYAGTITKTFKITAPGFEGIASDRNYERLYGYDRYSTAIFVADSMRAARGISKFDTIIVADGLGYADALSGTYLAAVEGAPILTVGKDTASQNIVRDYIVNNLNKDGKVYILGGTNAVSGTFGGSLSKAGIKVKRIGGLDRYDTNIKILKEAGVGDKEMLVCSGVGFADSLSASSTGRPILLVGNNLTADQKAYLNTLTKRHYYVIGGTKAVSNVVETQLKTYGTKERLTGANRFETSVAVANKFFGSKCKTAVLAYGLNYPDGLSGGALAYELDAPLLLATSTDISYAKSYVKSAGIEKGIVIGGPKLISDYAFEQVIPHVYYA